MQNFQEVLCQLCLRQGVSLPNQWGPGSQKISKCCKTQVKIYQIFSSLLYVTSVRVGLFCARGRRRTFFLLDFSVRVGLFWVRGGLFSTGGGLFLVGGGLFPSPTVAEKSPTPARKSPTPRKKVQLQSQKGVGLWNIPVNLSSQVHLWSSGLWMLEEYYCKINKFSFRRLREDLS